MIPLKNTRNRSIKRIAIVGDPSAGKTTLLHQLIHIQQQIQPTIGLELHVGLIGNTVVEFVDTGYFGHPKSIECISDCDGFIVVVQKHHHHILYNYRNSFVVVTGEQEGNYWNLGDLGRLRDKLNQFILS